MSTGTGRRYPVTMVCAVWCVSRSTVYAQRGQARRPARTPQKRGPRTLVSDAVLLKEECLYLHDFETLEQAREVIGEFVEAYNGEWLIERHGHRTPADVRQALTKKAA